MKTLNSYLTEDFKVSHKTKIIKEIEPAPTKEFLEYYRYALNDLLTSFDYYIENKINWDFWGDNIPKGENHSWPEGWPRFVRWKKKQNTIYDVTKLQREYDADYISDANRITSGVYYRNYYAGADYFTEFCETTHFCEKIKDFIDKYTKAGVLQPRNLLNGYGNTTYHKLRYYKKSNTFGGNDHTNVEFLAWYTFTKEYAEAYDKLDDKEKIPKNQYGWHSDIYPGDFVIEINWYNKNNGWAFYYNQLHASENPTIVDAYTVAKTYL